MALADQVKGVRHSVVRCEFQDEVGEGQGSYGLKVGRRARRGLAGRLFG